MKMIVENIENLAIIILPKDLIKEFSLEDGEELLANCSITELGIKRDGGKEVRYKRVASKAYELK